MRGTLGAFQLVYFTVTCAESNETKNWMQHFDAFKRLRLIPGERPHLVPPHSSISEQPCIESCFDFKATGNDVCVSPSSLKLLLKGYQHILYQLPHGSSQGVPVYQPCWPLPLKLIVFTGLV